VLLLAASPVLSSEGVSVRWPSKAIESTRSTALEGHRTTEIVPPPFEEVCFGDFDDQQQYPTPAELEKLLTRVHGPQHSISETTKRLSIGDRRISRISGVFRLNTPWNHDTTLRLSLIDPQLFQLHFWRGDCGVTLRYCPAAVKTWGAYGTTRRSKTPYPATPFPATYADWALDCGRFRRCGLGTFEVRYHNGNIVLTRGDLLLLSVPLDGLPTEVYLQGSALVRGMSIYRSTGGPKPPEPDPVVLCVDKPAEETWQTALANGVAFQKLPDGAVQLAAEANAPTAQAGLRIPGPGLYQYIFELQGPHVGTGIFLAGRDGRQLARFAFYRDTTTRRTTFAYLAPDLEATELEYHFERAMVPYAGTHQWVRLTLGGGVMKCWTSGDRVHWSQSIWSPLAVQGPVEQVGLYCIRTDQQRSIELRSLEVRRLEALSSLAPEEIQRRVGSLADCATIDDWDDRVAESQPPDVPPDVWQRACILRTLADNPYFSLGGKLINRLIEQVVDDTLPDDTLPDKGDLHSQLKLLDEAAILIHCLDAQATKPFLRHYERLGMQWMRAGHPNPLNTVAAAVMRTPIWNFDRQNAWPDRLFRHELLARAAEDRWPEVQELFASIDFWTRADRLENRRLSCGSEVQHVVDWAEFQIERRRTAPTPGESFSGPLAWRSPLIERLSKEAYNVAAEFRSAIEAGAYTEACQIISSSAVADLSGLLPDAEDRRLLVSMPAAVELAMQTSPDLQRVMQQHFGELGWLRLKQAIAAGDPAAVKAVTVQLYGTAAAAEAHVWLGDRLLSAGRIAQAAGHYRHALPDASAQQRDALFARLRLAGAILGRDVGRPVTAAVQIGNEKIPAAEFEQMVQQIRHANRHAYATAHSTADLSTVTGAYEAHPWARIDGRQVQPSPHVPEDGFDLAARQTTAVVVDGQMIVNNRVELTVFDLGNGKRQWSDHREVGTENSHWPAVPMRPTVTDKLIFTRLMTDAGPELACFDRLTGEQLWRQQSSDYVACDPLLVGQDLFALTVAKDEGSKLSLRLAQFDCHCGRLHRETLLAEFDDRWQGRLPCQAIETEGKIVTTAAGCVVCCDPSGRLNWIRQQVWIPAPSNEYSKAVTWFHRRHFPPPVAAGRVYATQPGVWNIECLDLQSGRLVWRKAVPEMTALLGRFDQRLIVETTDGFLAKDADSGDTLWRHRADNRTEAWLCRPGPGIVYTQLADGTDRARQTQLALVHLDPADGEVLGRSTFDVPPHENPRCGPLVGNGSRYWLFTAAADKPAVGEILELTPVARKN